MKVSVFIQTDPSLALLMLLGSKLSLQVISVIIVKLSGDTLINLKFILIPRFSIENLVNFQLLDYTCTSYAESKPLAIATHSKGFEQTYHMIYSIDTYN